MMVMGVPIRIFVQRIFRAVGFILVGAQLYSLHFGRSFYTSSSIMEDGVYTTYLRNQQQHEQQEQQNERTTTMTLLQQELQIHNRVGSNRRQLMHNDSSSSSNSNGSYSSQLLSPSYQRILKAIVQQREQGSSNDHQPDNLLPEDQPFWDALQIALAVTRAPLSSSSSSSKSAEAETTITTTIPTTLDSSNPVICQNITTTNGHVQHQCCGIWNVNADEWWLHHPHYEVSLENQTHFCFTPIQNQIKVNFLQQLHEVQWNSDCTEVEKSVDMNSGYGAGISWLLYSFWHAYSNQKPFQICHTNRRWLYSSANESSWGYCKDESQLCYYLPISPCDRNETVRGMHKDKRPQGKVEEQQAIWMRQYMLRPQQFFRQKQYKMRQKLNVPVGAKCTTMHVRRGDAGFARKPYRRYAAVSEYIEKGKIQPGDNIVLLTDDSSTITEIKRYHPEYNWYYYDRPRNQNIVGGFDGHIPSGDEAFELLVIESELKLAQSCDKFVYGHSGFMKQLVKAMVAEEKNFTSYYVDTSVSQAEATKFKSHEERVESFFREIEARHNNKTKTIKLKQSQDVTASSPEKSNEDEFKNLQKVIQKNIQVMWNALEATGRNSVTCYNTTTDGPQCCGTWDIDADNWWLHHPDWQVTYENDTSFCFSPYKNQKRVEFLRSVHERQWVTGSCDEVETTHEINSGKSSVRLRCKEY